MYTLYQNNIINNIGRVALEQAYRSLRKLDSNYIHINVFCTTSTSIKSIKT